MNRMQVVKSVQDCSSVSKQGAFRPLAIRSMLGAALVLLVASAMVFARWDSPAATTEPVRPPTELASVDEAEPARPSDDTHEVVVEGKTFRLPIGLTIERAVPVELVQRPIHAAFDEQGNLYVTESSGTNDPVTQQLEDRPHAVFKLTDTDHDGVYDQKTVFADRMMFPEGAMWFDGSLYVSAPPVIWKLTDEDGDGVCDRRDEWFNGNTLTGCANDLHGPYLGRDGWIYWCKGAFAEQTYATHDGGTWSTRAAHIFRQRPEGSVVEPVMTGGMDNPVEVVFTDEGERIFNTTFLQHPGGGRRDGLIHAIYGGVYGKSHGVLEGHPRTGPLMPVLVHLDAAAPSGLLRLESNQLGLHDPADPDSAGVVLATLFNMRKITSHRLHRNEATFGTEDQDFLVCDDLDFHATDILEDADGSLLVVDTGGWYKLCCPTSQLWKPDILGTIYRIKRDDAEPVMDPRGLELDWTDVTSEQLVDRLNDARHVVRQRSTEQLSRRGEEAVDALIAAWQTRPAPEQRQRLVWALSWIDLPSARQAVRVALRDRDPRVVHTAAHVVSVWRDSEAVPALIDALYSDSMAVRRAAAEAIGRVGGESCIEPLLHSFVRGIPRELEHSVIYALIELNMPEPIRDAIASFAQDSANFELIRRGGIIAMSQMNSQPITSSDIEPLLASDDPDTRAVAVEIISQHAQWESLRAQLVGDLLQADGSSPRFRDWRASLQRLLNDPATHEQIAEAIGSGEVSSENQVAIFGLLSQSTIQPLPQLWMPHIEKALHSQQDEIVSAALSLLRPDNVVIESDSLLQRVVHLAADDAASDYNRLQAADVATRSNQPIGDATFALACGYMSNESPGSLRAIASQVIQRAATTDRVPAIIEAIEGAGPVELTDLINVLVTCTRESHGAEIVAALSNHPSTTSVDIELLKQLLSEFAPEDQTGAAELLDAVASIDETRLERIRRVLPLVDRGDIRHGQRLFHGTKASCAACHELGYLGGDIGPDLTRIGRIRSAQDLLESIIFPSATFVRSYEPITLITVDGRVYTGVLRNESSTMAELAINEEDIVRIPRDDIEERVPGTVSIMPAGLDQQLTDQELADIVKFLLSSQ